MSGSAAEFELNDRDGVVSSLNGRVWPTTDGPNASRIDLVSKVVHWMPYPLSYDLLSLDLAAAALEAGDDGEARDLLRSPGVRAALIHLLDSLLGSGSLGAAADQDTYLRSCTLTEVVREDLTRLAECAGRDDRKLLRLAKELRLDQALWERTVVGGLSPLVSAEVARRTSGSPLKLDAGVPELMTGRIDPAVVPPRVFRWRGPSYAEIRGTKVGDGVDVRAAIVDDAVESGDFVAFVTNTSSGAQAEAPLVRQSEAKRLRAKVEVRFPGPHLLGIRARVVEPAHAVDRLLSNEAGATRYLLEAWTRLRLGAASLVVENASGLEVETRWLDLQPQALVELAQKVAQDPLATAAGPTRKAELRMRSSRLRGETRRLARSGEWDARATNAGTNRPLLSEILYVSDFLDASKASAKK